MNGEQPVLGEVAIGIESARWADYWILMKPRIIFLVVFCTAIGFIVGAGQTLSLGLLAYALLGTVLVSAGGAVLNQYCERDADALMIRTLDRPLPAGRLEPREALIFGIVLIIAGVLTLGFLVNVISMVVGLLSVVLYVLVYTPLKRRTPWCMVVGAVAGAFPPVIGWTASTDQLGLGAVGLFAILFLWQFPHFLAIAWLYREDYDRAGFAMAPLNGINGIHMIPRIRLSLIIVLAASFLPIVTGQADVVYMIVASIIGLAFLLSGFRRHPEELFTYARRVYGASLIYLPILLVTLAWSRPL